MAVSIADRALGALVGLALGDALGMPTQCLPFAHVQRHYASPDGVLPGFLPGLAENELSAGMAAGRVTDDTDQALILARLVVAGDGVVDQPALAHDLLAWQSAMIAAGSSDLLGPSTTRALNLVAAGADPASTGRWGDTDGAAMRIAPIGIATPARPLETLVDAVHAAGRLTHDTGVAVAGAAAVAAAVSAGLEGADVAEACDVAIEAAHLGAERGHYVPGADVASRIGWALDVTAEHSLTGGLELIDELIGTGVATQEAVPATFAVLSLAPSEPWLMLRAAAALGGDCDTIAAMAGAIAGAIFGVDAFPRSAVEELHRANPALAGDALPDLASSLLAIRALQ